MLRSAMATVLRGPTVFSHRYGRHLVRFEPKRLAMVVKVNSAPRRWISSGRLLCGDTNVPDARLNVDFQRVFQNFLYLVGISADGAAWRKLCSGGFGGFRGWTPLTGDGKRSPLVAVERDDPSCFVDDVMDAIFF